MTISGSPVIVIDSSALMAILNREPKSRLNFCDCAAYALAKSVNAPLFFKGDDFFHTDVARL